MVDSVLMMITIANFKGGVGKTTTAIHVAGYLATKGKTLLVDGDQNRSSLEWSEAGNFNFDVISPKDLNMTGFDHIVVDTEARPKPKDLKTLSQVSDLIILPTTPDAMSIKATVKTFSDLEDLDAVNFKILITMTPPPPSHDGEDAGEFLRKNNLPVFKTTIRRYTAYRKASLSGCLVCEVKNPYARIAWSDYEKIGKEILR
jgi:chromosome partitioning protein